MHILHSELTDLLFQELQKLLLQRRDGHTSAGGGSSPSSLLQWLEHPAVAQELDEWWSAAPACLRETNTRQQSGTACLDAVIAGKEQHERFYQQLGRGVSEVSPHEEIAKAMTTDFLNDTCNSRVSLSDEERFKRSILALAAVSSAIGDPTQSAESIVIRLRELYEVATFADTRDEASGSKATGPGGVKLSPQRNAKQRSWSNSERSLIRTTNNPARKMRQSNKTKIMGGADLSATLSKRLSTARLARTPSGISQLDSSSDLSAAGNNLDDHLSSLSLHDSDDSSHFFSIETRLELKEHLVALQKQLSELLVQTKLAWMKCFANDSKPHTGPEISQSVASKEALNAANELATKGELLMTKLHTAFTKATSTSNCPIKEYQDLVESVEIDFRGFQQLVGSIAHHSCPLAPALHQESSLHLHKELKSSTSEPTLKPAVSHPVSFDLPSMKSYCAKVAPPYSSYLVKKK